MPEVGETKKSIPSFKPNFTSVVLHLEIQQRRVLLGGDLEKTNQEGTGWSCILDSSTRPQQEASVYKIAHHGSKNADHPDIWKELLIPNPVASLSPQTREPLPTKEDVSRLRDKTDKGYSTAPVKRSQKDRSHTVEKKINEVVESIGVIDPLIGQVRVRTDLHSEDEWQVDRFRNAVKLKNVY